MSALGRSRLDYDGLPAHAARVRATMVAMPVLVTNEFPPAGHGGIGTYVLRLAGEIAAAGRDVVVVAPQAAGDAAFDAALPYRVCRFALNEAEPLPLVLARIAKATIRAHGMTSDRSTIAASWIRTGAACAMLPRSLRGPLAILAHGSEILSQRNPVKKAAMRATFARAAVVAANSEFTAGILADAGIRRTPVIARCGVQARPSERRPAAAPTILSVGRLVRRKGFDRTIEAVAMLRERFPEIRYEIIGGGTDEGYLRERVAQLGVERHVALLGAVTDEELAQAYARAWCFSLPARRVGGDVEGFGIVYLEAAMAGVPAIGGLGSGAQEAIEDDCSGLLVDGESIPAIAGALEALLGDERRNRAMGTYARKRALERFNWRIPAESILAALDRARAGSNRESVSTSAGSKNRSASSRTA